MADYLLYDYWRSSASYRVRLGLAYKGLTWDHVSIDLRHDVQSGADYRGLNPQGLVPLLVADGQGHAQSLAILEYLEERHPDPPLLPADSEGRAQVRSAAMAVACDIHPLNNLRVLRYLKGEFGCDQAVIDAWARHWIVAGLTSLESFATRYGGSCLWKDRVSLADLCLIPQLYNARRVAADLAQYPRLLAIESHCLGMEWAGPATPEAHPDRNG